jgi:hypothetical protein
MIYDTVEPTVDRSWLKRAEFERTYWANEPTEIGGEFYPS